MCLCVCIRLGVYNCKRILNGSNVMGFSYSIREYFLGNVKMEFRFKMLVGFGRIFERV